MQGSGFRVQDLGGTVVVHEQDAGEGGVEGGPVPRVPRLRDPHPTPSLRSHMKTLLIHKLNSKKFITQNHLY